MTHFVGQVVKVTQHTSRIPAEDLYRRWGTVVELGHTHVSVNFGTGINYWMPDDVVIDVGSAS